MRHRWSEPTRFPFKTERSCMRIACAIVKVTRHEPGQQPWQEFWREGERIAGTHTPPCDGKSIPAGGVTPVQPGELSHERTE